MTKRKTNVVIYYISPFTEDSKVVDYDGSMIFGESVVDYKNSRLIYFMRAPFSQDGSNGKLEAEVQGEILEGPVEGDRGKEEYVIKRVPRSEKRNITDLVRSKRGKDISVKFR